ncbi:Proto-chlorophyllide reductase 57 kD subunit domain protein [Candidatus Magnetoovum chiemensis]|nr:Proto-chlorophyllide reductase 57 kD subunit domain protein [Candidatus Magnetoovum chiemensis]
MKFICLKCSKEMKGGNIEACTGKPLNITYSCADCGCAFVLNANQMEAKLINELCLNKDNPHTAQCLDSLIKQDAENETAIPWDKDAQNHLLDIPSFVRSMAKSGIDKFAVDKGYKIVTLDVMEQARKSLYNSD